MEGKEGEHHGLSEEAENEQFEEVLFKDNEKNDDIGSEEGSPKLDGVGRLSIGPDRHMMDFDASPIGLGQKTRKSLGTPTVVDEEGELESPSSVDDLYDEFGYSPMGSPPAYKEIGDMPIVFPELLHLIDSVIMGESKSLEKLKNVVNGVETFGNEWEDGIVAYLTVDSLLETMGGIENLEDDNPPTVILNSRAAVVSAELLPWLPCKGDSNIAMSPRSRMVRGLLAALQACTRNRAVCSTAGVLSVLLRSAQNIFVRMIDSKDQMRWDAAPLFYCIEYLAEHSLSIIDLQTWFQVITQTPTTALPPILMAAFEKAIAGKESTGPACSFELFGETSGLLGPGDSSWPFSNGYAFATWIYIESFTDTSAVEDVVSSSGNYCDTALPGEDTAHISHLFNFSSGENEGMRAYFRDDFLVVESGNGRGKKASLHFTYAFKPECWYFIGVEHTCHQVLLGKDESELRLYIDGSLQESHLFEFPQISKPLDHFCIGTNHLPTMSLSEPLPSQCSLFGEMGPIYIFKEPIGPEKMAYLARRGSDVLPSSVDGAGLSWIATSDYVRSMAEESSILDAEISGYIYALYHPKLLSGHSCPDASLNSEVGLPQRPARVLGQVHIATRIRPVEALWAFAYGGPMSLLPLTVSNMKSSNLEPEQENLSFSLATTALAAPVFRIVALSIRHPGNSEELCRGGGPEILSKILHYLLQTWSSGDVISCPKGEADEELVAAIISLCLSPEDNHALKVQLFSMLLLDLQIWSCCNYGLQKRLLSSLTNMVVSESSVLKDANAIQMLLDGCRRCYSIVRETNSACTSSLNQQNRPVGVVNALVEDVFTLIELLLVEAPPSSVLNDMPRLLGFIVDCPQPNQVSRAVHLLYRLVVQQNISKSKTFVKTFLSCGGIEALLILLQREVVAGDHGVSDFVVESDDEDLPMNSYESGVHPEIIESFEGEDEVLEKSKVSCETNDSSESDGIALAIIKLLSSLIVAGHLKVGSQDSEDAPINLWVAGMHASSSSMFEDRVCLLFFSLLKAFHAAPTRLLTSRVYTALLRASINAAATDDRLNLYDSSHRFQCLDILVILLRSLPNASRAVQRQALQDLLFLACSHSDNRSFLIEMKEWPEWILEVLISNYERGSDRSCNSTTMEEIDDLAHNFLADMLESCMRTKDGWKEVEAIIHCAEWLSVVGGSSIRDHRIRREEALPIFKRRLLGTLLDFYAQELPVQTRVDAAASSDGDCPSPKNAEAEDESDSLISMVLAENAIVVLMLVENHLRLQSNLGCAFIAAKTADSSLKFATPINELSNPLNISSEEPLDDAPCSISSPSHEGNLPQDVLTSMAENNGQISSTMMECLTAAAAAEPYDTVSSAFVSYGSCASDLVEGWRYRSRLWYGVGLPSKEGVFGGGGSGWVSWNSRLEKDSNGKWIETPLIKKSIAMLQALLLDETELDEGLSIGGRSATRSGGMDAVYQLLDSDQPFLCMFRMVLLSLREEDSGESNMLVNSLKYDDLAPKAPYEQAINIGSLNTKARMSMRPSRSALLWSVLSLILSMPVSEAKRQRVLVTSCVLYSEIWHAIGKDRNPLRKKYLEAIIPAFVCILRRWRPVLAGIHELAIQDGLNPLAVDSEALAADALPLQAALGMISPGWAAAFASPPAAMALAMTAAGASGGEAPRSRLIAHLRRDGSLLERNKTKLQTFSSFQEPLEQPQKLPSTPREKATAKASAWSSARNLKRNAKVGSGRGLIAVAMATSAKRRSEGDMQRAERWSICEAMDIAWMECLHPLDTSSVYGKDLDATAYEFIAVLVASFSLAKNIQWSEIERWNKAALMSKHRLSTGSRAWRKLIHHLIETNCLYGPSARHLCNPEKVCWRLNFMENSCRMRRCLRRNYRGSVHFGSASNILDCVNSEQSQSITNPSNYSILFPQAISSIVITKGDDHSECYSPSSKNFEAEEHWDMQPTLSIKASIELEPESGDEHVPSNRDMKEVPVVIPRGYFPRDHDEIIILELHSTMVRLLKVVQGAFQITSKRINFFASNAEGNAADDRLDYSSKSRNQVKNHSWMMSSLNVVHSRRYLLRRSALELFMLDRSILFFDFGSNVNRRNAYKAIIEARPIHLTNVYLATEKPDQLLLNTQLMERWARCEITNFEYLMELNTLAGRSYNDITQYPIFPWILSDYNSDDLDLSNPDSYRDLSKPVGALNPEHLRKVQQHYSSFNDPFIPKFHYESHYSSAGAVLFYLVRLEPFTTLSIQLQGGKFNHEEGMFSDIAATWRDVLEDTSDVKELVPELFYLPESLTSQHSIDFGMEKYGVKLDDVKLPAWAKDPVDFVHKHRMALESEHVSAHLHEWIDLIFGYKQRGNEARVANNVFFCGSYEGAIDVNKISDPVKRRATQEQIAYLGQTPSQLLTVPHMKRMPSEEVLYLQTIFRNPQELKPYVVSMPELCNLPASAIHSSSNGVIIVDTHTPAAHIALHKWHPNTGDGQEQLFILKHGEPATNPTSGALLRLFQGSIPSDNHDFQSPPRALAFAASRIRSHSAIVGITKYEQIITGGHADNSIRLLSVDGAKTLEVAFVHHAPVTCLSLSSDSSYLVTGSQDTTAILWRMYPGTNPVGGNKHMERIHILHGHHREIVCCCVNSDLGVVVTSSHSSDILLHTTTRGRLIRRIVGVEAHEICFSSDGIIMAWNQPLQTLTTFTLNGIIIATAQFPFYGSIKCMQMSSDAHTVVFGVNNSCPEDNCVLEYPTDYILKSDSSPERRRLDIPSPCICFLDIHTHKVLHTLDLEQGQDISALALNNDHTHLLVSTSDNQLLIFTHPPGS